MRFFQGERQRCFDVKGMKTFGNALMGSRRGGWGNKGGKGRWGKTYRPRLRR